MPATSNRHNTLCNESPSRKDPLDVDNLRWIQEILMILGSFADFNSSMVIPKNLRVQQIMTKPDSCDSVLGELSHWVAVSRLALRSDLEHIHVSVPAEMSWLVWYGPHSAW